MRLRLLLICIFIATITWTATAQDDDFPEDILEDGAIEIEEVNLQIEEEFDDEDAWEFYEFTDESGSSVAQVTDSTYQIQRDFSNSWLWAYDDTEFEDSVIRVETEQLSRDNQNWYGVMCRADAGLEFEGYGFFISGDGHARITIVADGDVRSLDENTDVLEEGQEDNEILAVCAGEYLALYVNDELVAEAEDDTFDEGVTGFAVIGFGEDEGIHIAFDNLFVWEVEDFSTANSGGRSSTRPSRDDVDVDVDDAQDEVEDTLEEGDESIDLEDVVLVETWDEEGDWAIYEDEESSLQVDDGAYLLAESESGIFISGENRTEHDDMVLTVTAEQLSDTSLSGYGVICRVDPDNLEDGYAFLIRGDGFYTVGYWENNEYTSFVEGDDESIWDSADAINEGEAINQITVVCVDDYLAFYANGDLIFETEDDTFDEGYTAMAVVAFNDEEIEVAFDNLVIWEADN